MYTVYYGDICRLLVCIYYGDIGCWYVLCILYIMVIYVCRLLVCVYYGDICRLLVHMCILW